MLLWFRKIPRGRTQCKSASGQVTSGDSYCGRVPSVVSGREDIKHKTKRRTARRGGTSCFPNNFFFSEALSNYIILYKMVVDGSTFYRDVLDS